MKERRTHRVVVMLNDQEHRDLKRAAGEEVLGVFARNVLTRFLKRRKPKK